MTQEHIILHLSLIDGIGPSVVTHLLEYLPDSMTMVDCYNFSTSDFVKTFDVARPVAQKLVEGLSTKRVLEQELALIDRHAINWVTIACEQYPTLLKTIHLPPIVLYWQGALPHYQRAIAFVGSRAASPYGARAVHQLIPELVLADCVIVSGGALGIDTLSHQAAVDAGGKTIAVLGAGLLSPISASNKQLFNAIIHQGGTVLSSFPLMMPGYSGNFPARNRIISGLSHGTVVVQAAKKSGALITAHYALEQGREVFAVPGSIDDPFSFGCHALIQQGAKLVTTASDITAEFGWIKHAEHIYDAAAQMSVLPLSSKKRATIKSSVVVDSIQGKVINLCIRPTSIDDLAITLQMNLFAVQALLFDMQLEGLIEQDFAGLWRAR